MMNGFSFRQVIVICLILALLSAAAVLFGLGGAFPKPLTPTNHAGHFKRIFGDGWVEQGATIRFSDLAPRGNRLTLHFDTWRPAGNDPAHLRFFLCDSLVSELVVTPSSHSTTLFLTGECNPREVRIEVVNPFVPSEKDRRELGAKLTRAELSSKFGVPILSPEFIAQVASFVFVFLALMSIVLMLQGASLVGVTGAAVVSALAAGALLSTAEKFEFTKLFALWVLFTSIVAGFLLQLMLAKRQTSSPDRREDREREELAPLLAYAAIAVVVIGAGALRFYGLSFGLPNNYHPDEVPKVNAIMRMVEHGNLNPQYFLHPTLLLYSTYFFNSVFHWTGIIDFEWLGIPGDFRNTAFFAGRTVSALAGTLSILILFCIGKRLYGAWTGVLAALILAVLPLHVTCSRYLKEDALLTFWVLLSLATMLRAVQKDHKSLLLLAGLFAGAAASTKYSGMLAALIVASAPWLRSRSFIPDASYFPVTVLSVVMVPLGFIICTPYSVLDSATFIKDFQSEQRHMIRGHTIPVDPWSQYWMYHFWRSIVPGMSLVTTVVGVMGVGLLLWRRRLEDWFVVGLVLLFYLPAEWVKAKPEPQPERYIFPCLPILAIAASELVRSMRGGAMRAASLIVVGVIVTVPAIRSVQLASEVRDDTRTQMARWMIENLPRGSKVYLDWKPYAPRFWNNEFEVTHIPRARILDKLALDNLKSSGQDYLVLSGLFYERYFTQPEAAPMQGERIRQVFERVPIIKQFEAPHGTYGFHNPRLTLFSLKQDDFAKLEEELRLKETGQIAQTTNELRAQFKWPRAK